MYIVSKQFTNRKQGDFESLILDKGLLKKIVEDMRNNAGFLSPLNLWHLVEKDDSTDALEVPDSSVADLYDQSMMEQYNSAEKMLDLWIGCKGMQDLSKEEMESKNNFIKNVDVIGIFDFINENKVEDFDYKARDIDTIADINMIYAGLEQTPHTADNKLKLILEIGGGYGRIAEAMMNVITGIKYVMIDAVPGSLLYAYKYLEKMLPDKKVGFYYLGEDFDLDKYDIYIIPAWHFERENGYKYDCGINIASMEEMGQEHVDYYLNLLNKVLNDDGILYLQNAHDYVFKGEWKFKNNWERVLMSNSPASWTEYFPTEMFRKRNKDYTRWNQCILASYEYSLYEKRSLKKKISDMQNEVWRLQYAESELEKCRKEVEVLKKRLEENENSEKEQERKGYFNFFRR